MRTLMFLARRRTPGGGGRVVGPPSNTATVTTGTPATAAASTYPDDANVIDLSLPPYNVTGDGTSAAANTTAINNALATYSSEVLATRFSFRTLVLPEGTVAVNNTLAAPGNAIRLTGAGESRTTIKLVDNATGYGSAGTPKLVVKLGIEASLPGDNAAYANYVTDLTIDVGSGNPGAVALRGAMCNTGAIERVTLKGGTGANTSGLRGLIFETSPGPALVMDVTIIGFDQGIWADSLSVNNMIFSNITLQNQRTVGIRNVGKCLQFEGLTVTGAPKVYEGTGQQAVGQFIDATFTGPGSGTALTAVAGSYMYARNVTATGWGNLITHSGTTRFSGKTAISEWGSLPYLKGNATVAWTENTAIVTPNLPHPKAPRSPVRPTSEWVRANVTSGAADMTAAINQAISTANAQGKKVVYLPYGNYTVAGTVTVNGQVERLDFMGSRVSKGSAGKISVNKAAGTFAVVQNVSSNLVFEQNGAGTAVFRHGGPNGNTPGQITTGPNATGDMHCENFAAGHPFQIDRPIRFFVRGSNREGQPANFTNGVTAWLFGDNVESHDDRGNPFMVISGSTVELLGGVWDNLATLGRFNSTTGTAMIEVTNSDVGILYPGVYRGAAITGHWLREQRAGATVGNVVTSDVYIGPAVGEWKRAVMPLYVSPAA